MLFVANAVFQCFLRNLQPALRVVHTEIHFAALLAADFYRGTHTGGRHIRSGSGVGTNPMHPIAGSGASSHGHLAQAPHPPSECP